MAALHTATVSSFFRAGILTLHIASKTGFASWILVCSDARIPIIVMQSAAEALVTRAFIAASF